MNGTFIAGLDIGATAVRAAVGRVTGGAVEIVGAGSASPAGTRKGVIADMAVAADAIARAVAQAGDASGVEIKAVYAGISGCHVAARRCSGATGIKGRAVTEKDVERSLARASDSYVPLERDVLHVLPLGYAIDGQNGIERPVGMSGSTLEARVLVVTAPHAATENLARCCEKAGVELIAPVFEPVALAKAAAEPGSSLAVVDMGGDITSVTVLRGETITWAAVVPVGGSHLTNDICIGLRLTRKEAENLKTRHADASPAPEGAEAVSLTTMHGVRRIEARHLHEIVLPRCQETLELAAQAIAEDIAARGPVSAVVLTGGGSLLRSVEKAAEAVFGVPAARPRPVKGVTQSVPGPAARFATCVGLVLHGFEKEREASGALEGGLGRLASLAGGLFDLRNIGAGFRKILGADAPGSESRT
ncbi:MAG: cell division protein FtsA [Thermodesulfovibrionales bacterium]